MPKMFDDMWSQRKFTDTKEQFLRYCNGQLDSIKVAINKKAKGSTVEDDYFLEHLEKLRKYFLTTEVGK